MSEAGTAAVAANPVNTAPVAAAVNAATPSNTPENPVDAMVEAYNKKGRVVILAGDDASTFASFLDTFNETNPLTDWTKGAPWASPSMAVVTSEAGQNRLIGIADPESAFADPVVKKWLYTMYVRRVLNVAESNDASAEKFLTAAGCFKAKYDDTAFKDDAKLLVHFLRGEGLVGVTIPLLRASLQNAAFASGQFPRIKTEMWGRMLDTLTKRALDKGLDVSLYSHWGATRNAMTDNGEAIELDFDALSKEMDEADDGTKSVHDGATAGQSVTAA